MKSYNTILAEQDTDYQYTLVSSVNIHDTDTLARIRLALGRYGLIEMTPKGVSASLDQDNGLFPESPFAPVYYIDLVMAHPLSARNAIQTIGLHTKVGDRHLKFLDADGEISADGAEYEQHAHPVAVPAEMAQEEVGQARVENLMTELMKELAAKREETIEIPVYEGWVANHRDIKKASGRNLKPGYYMFENLPSGGVLSGPFSDLVENHEYRETLGKLTIGEAVANGALMEYEADYEPDHSGEADDAGRNLRGEIYQAEVIDETTGREFKIAVRAHSISAAREAAVDTISQKEGINRSSLIVTSPKEIHGN